LCCDSAMRSGGGGGGGGGFLGCKKNFCGLKKGRVKMLMNFTPPFLKQKKFLFTVKNPPHPPPPPSSLPNRNTNTCLCINVFSHGVLFQITLLFVNIHLLQSHMIPIFRLQKYINLSRNLSYLLRTLSILYKARSKFHQSLCLKFILLVRYFSGRNCKRRSMGLRLGRNPCPVSAVSGLRHCHSQ